VSHALDEAEDEVYNFWVLLFSDVGLGRYPLDAGSSAV
jgi:hypothetical protein